MHHIRIEEQPAPTTSPTPGSGFQISYSAVNDSPSPTASTGHKDYIAIVGAGGTNVYEHWHQQDQIDGNAGYAVYLDVPGLAAGDYQISVSLDTDANTYEQGSANFTVS